MYCTLSLAAQLRNVLLLRDDEAPQVAFHPRFQMTAAPAFLELEEWQQEALRQLYQDYFFHRQARRGVSPPRP